MHHLPKKVSSMPKKWRKRLFRNFKKYFLKQKYLWFFLPLIGCMIVFYIFILKDLPSPTRLATSSQPQSTHIYDRHDKLLYTIYGKRNQTFVPLTQIPRSVQEATIAIEDKDFYKHGAIDLRGITRAFFATLFKKQLQGGSTLTQQLVKNSLLTQDRTIQRKIKELLLSYSAELLYSKQQILEMYLNQVPYGGTAYGVGAASQAYFGKKVTDLTLAQSAFLAALPESPSAYSPFGTHPELGKERQEIVLKKMYEQNYITQKEYEQARNEPLHFQSLSDKIEAPHFVFYIKDLLTQEYGEERVEQGGLNVKTSLDLNLQNFVQDTVATEVAKLKDVHVGNGAALVTDPTTGEILAMVGSKDYFDPQYGNVNMTLAHLQPGSSIKPINYAVGLLKGYTAATPFIDEQMCFPGTPPYCPKNYDNQFHGVVQMRYALANSVNIPAVEMLKLNTVDAMIATASAMGISTFTDPQRYGLSLTLGGGEVTMLDMAKAYGVFANQGYKKELHPILRVTDPKGKVLEEYVPDTTHDESDLVLPEGVTYIISHILLDNAARATEFGLYSALNVRGLPVSVKTGTTNDFRDNWTIGYTHGPEHYVAAVWVGNNDHTPMSGIVSGITGAAPIWHQIMMHLLDGKKASWPHQPASVVGATVCATSGLLPPPDGTPDRCPTRYEYFLQGTVPTQVDPGKQKVLIDKATNDLAKDGQTDNVEERDEIVVTDPLQNRYCLTCPHPSPSPTPAP